MTGKTAAQAISEVTSALVGPFDITDVLMRLMKACAELLEADAVGLIVRPAGSGDLELLAATSHDATELEVYQVQQNAGPCVDCIHLGHHVSRHGRQQIDQAWPELHGAISSAGFEMVHAIPLNWRDQTLGGLNVFRHRPLGLSTDEVVLAQTLTDVATLALLQAPDLTSGEVDDRILAALRGRIVVEQAKGALAHSRGLSMDRAYRQLLELAQRQGWSLGAAAARVLKAAEDGTLARF
jgi:transcriptional regulator with GAF, ATPase, and Fis domain